jgi:toxin CcdB
MARFEVFPNPGSHADTTPYLLDVQSDLLDELETRVVIPLRSIEKFAKVKFPDRLIPVFEIAGQNYLMETPKMGAVPRNILKVPVASLGAEHLRITAALDFLFQGY